ncbi:MAG: tRNA (adenosine(37)-N6)-threonylcarbamoyltransferase complex ATPase subunit type 1 TsaE [Vulcanimicrobiota bacterium]
MQINNIKTNNLEETTKLGIIIAHSLKPGDGVLLTGDLGAGKTALTRGICQGLGVEETVKSPTFVLAWVYQGRVPVYHIDLYRLSDYDELENIGWEEMVDSDGIYIVEWADKFTLPYTRGALKIHLEYDDEPDARIINFEFDETKYSSLEQDLKNYENFGS